jgi:hypothetical protein
VFWADAVAIRKKPEVFFIYSNMNFRAFFPNVFKKSKTFDFLRASKLMVFFSHRKNM